VDYSSVNDGNLGSELHHEYDYIPANNYCNPVLLANNPAYQSTSYPSSTTGALWDKNLVGTNYGIALTKETIPHGENVFIKSPKNHLYAL